MLQLFKQGLDQVGLFDGSPPELVEELASSINNYRVPRRMKLTVAVSEFILFFSQFHKHIKLDDGATIPINSIAISIADSGAGKDSSKDAVRSCFTSAYKLINDMRRERAKERAIELADNDGVDDPHIFENYKSYYRAPQSLFSSPDSTIEGLIADFNGLQEEELGAGFIYSGEIADEMAKGIADLMQFTSETFDKGNKEVKKIKGAEKLQPLVSFPVSANFMGSQVGILFDPQIKQQFIKSFSSKLARRSYFMYAPEKINKPNFKSIAEFDAWMESTRSRSAEAKENTTSYILEVCQHLLDSEEECVTVSPEVSKVFDRYKAYNEELAETIEPQFPISKLVREHLQWKSLKFAGAIALSKGKFIIELEDYIEAVSFAEALTEDMPAFEKDLSKEPYETFVDFMHLEAFEDKSHISLHLLRKKGFIPLTGKPNDRIKELINLASSYDRDGIYTACDDGVCYEKQQLTDQIGVSYLEVSGSKDQRAKQCASGFAHSTYTFADLADMLKEDLAYSPFEFTDGIRGKDNIIGGCKWIVLDIDDSHITDEEAHFILSNVNHHIARTSDGENPFKFRVLIELDAVVDIPNQHWKPFISSIANSLSLTVDSLGKAQIFFSYADRPILSNLDGEPLATKEHILASAETDVKVPKALSTTEKSSLLKDISGTFDFALECQPGTRSVSLMRAAYYARDLGMPTEEILELVDTINDYWLNRLPDEEIEKNIKSQIRRW